VCLRNISLDKCKTCWPEQGLATGWTVQESNPGEREIYRICPDWPCGPPSPLYNGHQVSFPGVKRPGHGVDHPSPSSIEVKERVELRLYSPSGPSWPVYGVKKTTTHTTVTAALRKVFAAAAAGREFVM